MTAMSNDFPRLAQRLFNVPLLLRPEKAEMLCAALADRLGIAHVERAADSFTAISMRQDGKTEGFGARPPHKIYAVRDGVATIPVLGTLVHRSGWLDPMSGLTGYDGLDRKLSAARADPDVRAILFDADTPGGETAGCFELARKIYAGSARFGGKPVFWLANEMSCSAGYALASACDRIAIPREGITGSIGVYVLLVDFSRALDKNGLRVKMVRAGERKARTNPYEGWDDQAAEKMQALVDGTWRRFAEMVAKHRNITVKSVLDQEGDFWTADEAIERGLVDAICSPDEAVDALRRQVARV